MLWGTLLALVMSLGGCDLLSDEQEGGPGKLYGDGGYFGSRVALRGNRALVNARYDGAGTVFVFERKAGGWKRQAKLRADGLKADHYQFAWSLVLGAEGAFVGAIGEAQGPGGGRSKPGRVVLYEGNSGMWKQEARFASEEPENQDGFGTAVATHESRLLVGAHRKTFEGHHAGAAYVYKCNQSGCVREAMLVPDDLAPLDFFGSSVALERNWALVAAPEKDEAGDDSGVVYAFERTGDEWEQAGKLLPEEPEAFDDFLEGGFGRNIALDGSYAVASLSAATVDGVSAGAAYVFERAAGGTWQQAARLTAPDAGEGDYFGFSLDISGDYVIVGADLADQGRGAAYIYHRRSDGQWTLQTKLQPGEAGRSHFFGEDVAIDGRFAVVGMPGEDKEKGAAYVYEHRGEDWVRYGAK